MRTEGSVRPVLEVSGLAKSFGGNVVFSDVSCRIDAGQLILLRGDNASGKTTLLNVLTGHISADEGNISVTSRSKLTEIRFRKGLWQSRGSSPEALAKSGIGRSWQEIRLFPNHTVIDNVCAAAQDQIGENPLRAVLCRKRVHFAEQRNRADAMALLTSVEMECLAERRPQTLSLGQAKRAAIVRAVRSGATVLFLDEPLAGLDERGIRDVLTLILSLVRTQLISVVIVEHLFHIPKLLPFVTSVWTLSQGKLAVQEPSVVSEELKHAPVGILDWFQELSERGYSCSSASLSNGASVHFAHLNTGAAVVFDVQGLCAARGGVPVIGDAGSGDTGLSLQMEEGDIAFLEAPNGWGKTTLIETLAGITSMTAGTIFLNKIQINHLPAWERSRAGISVCRSSGGNFPSLTVSDVFRLGSIPVPPVLANLADRSIGELSGGQQQLVNAMRLLQNRRVRVRLLDEPFNMLDKPATVLVKNAIVADRSACTLLVVPATIHRTNNPYPQRNTLQGASST